MANDFITPGEFIKRVVEVAKNSLPDFTEVFKNNPVWENMDETQKAKCVVYMALGGVVKGLNNGKN